MAGDIDSSSSTRGCVYIVGGTSINWISRLQKVVTLSIIEADYIVGIEGSKEVIWLQRFMEELGNK